MLSPALLLGSLSVCVVGGGGGGGGLVKKWQDLQDLEAASPSDWQRKICK